MKYILKSLAIVLLSSFTSFAQTVSPFGDAPKGILFRGFENIVQVKDDMNANRTFVLEMVGGEVVTLEANDARTSTGRYILRPTGGGREAELIIKDEKGAELNRVHFTVSRLPESDVRFATKNGEFDNISKQLVIYNPFPFFEKQFEITAWKIELDGAVVSEGLGNQLTDEAMERLNNLPTGSVFLVEANVINIEGIIHLKRVQFSKH